MGQPGGASHSIPSLVILPSDRPGWDKTVSKAKPAYEQRVDSLKKLSLSTGDSEELHPKTNPFSTEVAELARGTLAGLVVTIMGLVSS